MVDFFQAGYSEGRARAYLADQQNTRDNNKDVRDEKYLGIAGEELEIKKDYRNIAQQELGIKFEELGMKKEEFGWKREDRNREQQIQEGMAQASQQGGYGAVVDFLKSVDPNKAIEFHSNKLKLDDSIMTNDLMQSRLPVEKNKAMFESYGMIAKMAIGLKKLPQEQQAAAYEQILPMIQKVIPDADKTLTPRMSMLADLAIAQGTPDSLAYSANKGLSEAKTDIAKYEFDIKNALANGYDENSEYVQQLKTAQGQKNQRSKLLEAQVARAEVIKSKDQTQAKMAAYKYINQTTDGLGFVKNAKALQPIVEFSDQLAADPNNLVAQVQLRQYIAGLTQSKAQTEADWIRTSTAAGYATWDKKLSSWVNGGEVTLNAKEIGQIRATFEQYLKGVYQNQLSNEDAQKQYLQEDLENQNIDWETLPKPSQAFSFLVDKEARKGIQVLSKYGLENIDPADRKDLLNEIKNAKSQKHLEAIINNAKQLMGDPK